MIFAKIVNNKTMEKIKTKEEVLSDITGIYERLEHETVRGSDALEAMEEYKEQFVGCKHEWRDVTIDWWTTTAKCKCGKKL